MNNPIALLIDEPIEKFQPNNPFEPNVCWCIYNNMYCCWHQSLSDCVYYVIYINVLIINQLQYDLYITKHNCVINTCAPIHLNVIVLYVIV